MATGKDVYKLAKSYMFEEQSSSSYDEQIVDIINKVLAEIYDDNNYKRVKKGKLPFIDGVENHLISSLDDEVDFEPEYTMNVIPRGIDSYLLMDDDLNKKIILTTEYDNAVTRQKSIVSSMKMRAAIQLAEEMANGS